MRSATPAESHCAPDSGICVRAFFSLHQSDVIPDARCAMLSDGHICRSAIEIATYMTTARRCARPARRGSARFKRRCRTNQANGPGSVFDLNCQTNRAAADAPRKIGSLRERLPTYLVQCNCRASRGRAHADGELPLTFERCDDRSGSRAQNARGAATRARRYVTMTAYVLAKPADSSPADVCACCGQVRHKCVTALCDRCGEQPDNHLGGSRHHFGITRYFSRPRM
jgi:hypothetical protein